MKRVPVSREAHGRIRLLHRALAADADRIADAIEALPPAMVRAALSKEIRSRAALRHVIQRMPASLVWQAPRQAGWRFLAPVEPDDVEMRVVLLGAVNRPSVCVESFGLRFSRHALGRLLDRTSLRADPIAAMLGAHDHLLGLDPREGNRIFELPKILIPAAQGAFVAEPSARSGNNPPLASCRTWISSDETFPDQDRILVAWQDLAKTDDTTTRKA